MTIDSEENFGESISLLFYEREAEYFGFTPLSFVDQILNRMNERIYESSDRLQCQLIETCSEDISHDQIEHGMQQLITLMESAVDKYFTVFEEYVIINVLNVPHNLALPSWRTKIKDRTETITEEEWIGLMKLKHRNQKLRNLNEALAHWKLQASELMKKMSYFQEVLEAKGIKNFGEKLRKVMLVDFPLCLSKVQDALRKANDYLSE